MFTYRRKALKISVVIPARNEEDGIQETIRAIPKSKIESMGYEVQIVVVDNDSNDGTAELARKAGADVVFEPRPGYGSAYKAGFAFATGDIIATADADATYPVEDIPRLVKILEEENLDFLTTNRFAMIEEGAMSFRNKTGNAILSLTMRLLFGLSIKDSQSGMWVFRSPILNEAKLRSNGMPLSEELKLEACYFLKGHWAEVPISLRERVGSAKIRAWRDGTANLIFLFKKRVRR